MTQSVNVNFRLEEDVKKRLEYICSELGLSMSALFTVFAKKVAREQRIPFDLSVDPFYDPANIQRLKHSIAEMEATGGTVHEVQLDD